MIPRICAVTQEGSTSAPGGILAVDDLFIPSVMMLHRYLLAEPAYQLVRIDGQKTAIYRKVSELSYASDWWSGQAMNRRLDFSFLPWPQRLRRYAGPWPQRLRRYAGSMPILPAIYQRLKGHVRK